MDENSALISGLTIRPEHPSDSPAIAHLIQSAFADGNETSDFVRDVRAQTEICLAQVVVKDSAIVAHAQYVRVPVTMDGRALRAAYLSCLSVTPALKHQGIGSTLVRQGLADLRAARFETVLLLGDPKYYGRFGFSSELARKIRAPHNQRGDGFQAVELVAGALAGREGRMESPQVLVPMN
jgi:putative acetyltransferase